MDLYLDRHSPAVAHELPVSRTAPRNNTTSPQAHRSRTNPFHRLDELASDLTACFTAACRRSRDAADSLDELVDALRALYADFSTACLAAIHFRHNGHMSCLHAVYSLFLAELLAPSFNLHGDTRRHFAGAALTANLGMYEYQDQWSVQTTPFSRVQWDCLKSHPDLSVARLRRIGVEHPFWLKLVSQHHERADGSGYPRGLSGDAIANEALLIGMIDRYLSFVMPRAGRKWVHPTVALRAIYREAAAHGENNIATFIRRLGVYPPGTAVRLVNGEIAVVTEHREGESTVPEVVSVGPTADACYDTPVHRDTADIEYRVKDIYIPDQEFETNPAFMVPAWT